MLLYWKFTTNFDDGNGLQAVFSYDARDKPLTVDIKDSGTSFLNLNYTYTNRFDRIVLLWCPSLRF